MRKNCLLCGVGGQGTVLASRILAGSAMLDGMFARTAETIGMAQRGGCVVSHVRYGDNVYSPLIPLNSADIILGFEPGEALRSINYLTKGGTIIVCDSIVNPVVATLSNKKYDGAEILEVLKKSCDKLHIIDTKRIIDKCGTPKVLNLALVGAALRTGVLGIKTESVLKIMEEKIPQRFMEMNKTALEMGAQMIE